MFAKSWKDSIRFSLPILTLVVCLLTLQAQDANQPANVQAVLKGHTEPVYSVAYSPDGQYVITGSFDQTLKIWDTKTGKEFASFGGQKGHQKMVLNVTVSPDGRLFASGGVDNKAMLWDFPTSEPVKTFKYEQALTASAVSPDQKKVAGGASDGTIKIWNADDGKELFTLKGHVGAVTSLAFSSNNQQLASSGDDGTLRFWSPVNGKLLSIIGAHTGPVKAMVPHPNFNAAYTTGNDGMLKFWQLPPTASKKLSAPHTAAITSMTLANNGAYMISGSGDKSVKVANVSSGGLLRQLTGPKAAVTSVAAARNNVYAAAGTADDQVFVWDYRNGKLNGTHWAHAGGVSSVDFHPSSTQLMTSGKDGFLRLWTMPPVEGKKIAHPSPVTTAALVANGGRIVTGSNDKIVRTYTVSNGRLERQYTGHTAPVTAVALSPNNQYLASGSEDNTIRFWNQSNGQQVAIIGAHAGKITSLTFHPNSSQLLSTSDDSSLKLWQMPPTPPRMFVHPAEVNCAVLTTDGQRMVTGCADKQVRLWNLSNGAQERTFGGNTLAVLSVGISNNNAQIAAGGADKSLTIWNASNAQVIKKIPNLPGAVHSVTFSPDNKTIAVGLSDNSIRIFDIAMGKEVKKVVGHGGVVTGLKYTPKGDVLISGSADKTVRLWTVANGKAVRTLTHGGAVHALDLSKDGTKVIVGSADKTAKLWNLADGKLLATVTTPAEAKSVGLSVDTKRVLIGGSDSQARLYEVSGGLLETFTHKGPVLAAMIHSDNKRMITTSADKTASAWNSSLVQVMRHAGAVTQAQFNPQGNVIVSGSADKSVKLWNPANGQLEKSIDAHASTVTGVSLTNDNQKIVSIGADKTVKLWTTATVKPGQKEAPLTLINLTANPQSVALTPDGTKVAVGSTANNKGQVEIFDTKTAALLSQTTDYAGPVSALAYHTDNRTLMSASLDKTIRMDNINAFKAMMVHKGGTTDAVFDNTGNRALTCGVDKTMKLWDLTQQKVIRTFGPMADPVTAVAFRRDYSQVAVAAGKIVQVFNVNDGKAVLTLTHPANVHDLSFNNQHNRMVTASADNRARVWDLTNGKELQAFIHDGPVRGVDFHPNNVNVVSGGDDKISAAHTIRLVRMVEASKAPLGDLAINSNGVYLFTGHNEKMVKRWNTGNGASDRTYLSTEAVDAVATNQANTLVALASTDKTIRLYNFNNSQLLSSFKAPAKVRSLDFNLNNQTLVAACEDGTVQTWNVIYQNGQPLRPEFGKPLQSFKHAKAVTDVVFGRDSSHFYSTGLDNTLKIWKSASSEPVRSFNHSRYVDAVAFTPDSKQLAVAGHDGNVYVYDVEKGNRIRQIQAHTKPAVSPIYCLAFSPDGKILATGSMDKSIKMWDPSNGKMIREIKPYKTKEHEQGHRDAVYCLTFSPDGKQLVSGSSDRTIKFWNVANGKMIRQLNNPELVAGGASQPRSHPGAVYGVRFSADGKQLFTAGRAPKGDGYLAVWNVADGKMLNGDALPVGPIYGLALAPDGKSLALGTGSRGRFGQQTERLNSSYLLKLPLAQ